jgi:hypothetical protein
LRIPGPSSIGVARMVAGRPGVSGSRRRTATDAARNGSVLRHGVFSGRHGSTNN